MDFTNPGTSQPIQTWRIALRLPSSTRDRDTSMVFMTNLPAAIAAVQLCALYRQCRKIEMHLRY
ncbi:hypothetical protein [Noviherbaspirillum soli]|uniref:hypothetical protein n=1 Tax=Noviherbaspirillum soli TaxID=1064518 RepID=UPI00188D579D|nr:hypothetical protein [Noviherbaspirillum soli]